jgi:hypothetical protein
MIPCNRGPQKSKAEYSIINTSIIDNLPNHLHWKYHSFVLQIYILFLLLHSQQLWIRNWESSLSKKIFGAVVQLVRISACHAEGRGFESRPHRQQPE